MLPADLYDADGVVRFNSEREYRKNVTIGPDPDHIHANIHGIGISNVPGYEKLLPSPFEIGNQN